MALVLAAHPFVFDSLCVDWLDVAAVALSVSVLKILFIRIDSTAKPNATTGKNTTALVIS